MIPHVIHVSPRRAMSFTAAVFSIALIGCAGIINAVGPAVCDGLAPIFGSGGEYFGTACKAFVPVIAKEIEQEIGLHPLQAKKPCTQLVAVPEEKPVAWICSGYEEPAKRALGAAAR